MVDSVVGALKTLGVSSKPVKVPPSTMRKAVWSEHGGIDVGGGHIYTSKNGQRIKNITSLYSKKPENLLYFQQAHKKSLDTLLRDPVLRHLEKSIEGLEDGDILAIEKYAIGDGFIDKAFSKAATAITMPSFFAKAVLENNEVKLYIMDKPDNGQQRVTQCQFKSLLNLRLDIDNSARPSADESALNIEPDQEIFIHDHKILNAAAVLLIKDSKGDSHTLLLEKAKNKYKATGGSVEQQDVAALVEGEDNLTHLAKTIANAALRELAEEALGLFQEVSRTMSHDAIKQYLLNKLGVDRLDISVKLQEKEGMPVRSQGAEFNVLTHLSVITVIHATTNPLAIEEKLETERGMQDKPLIMPVTVSGLEQSIEDKVSYRGAEKFISSELKDEPYAGLRFTVTKGGFHQVVE